MRASSMHSIVCYDKHPIIVFHMLALA
jgi:hypothetical protein